MVSKPSAQRSGGAGAAPRPRRSLLCPRCDIGCPSRLPNYGSVWIRAGIRYTAAPRPAGPSSHRLLLLKASDKYPQSTLTATGDNCICFTDELENVEQRDSPREPGPAAGARAACRVPARGGDGVNPRPSRGPGWTLRGSRAAPRLLRVPPGRVRLGPPRLAWQHGRWDGHPEPPHPPPAPRGCYGRSRIPPRSLAWQHGGCSPPWRRDPRQPPGTASRVPPPRVTPGA